MGSMRTTRSQGSAVPMVVMTVLEMTKFFIRKAVSSGGTVLDATVGNGHDTLFLASLVGPSGRVYGFDIQSEALDNARARIAETEYADRITLYHAGHEQAAQLLPQEVQGSIQAAMFNLGYLPGGDRLVVTTAAATITALTAICGMLQPHGVITVHVYTGHEGGQHEGSAVSEWVATLPWDRYRVARYDICNKQKNAELLLVIERLAE